MIPGARYKGRQYKRRFDHDEARRLHALDPKEFSAWKLAKKFGVSYQAIRRVIDPEFAVVFDARAQRALYVPCVKCGRPCSKHMQRHVAERGHYCIKCAGKENRTRFREDSAGNIVEVRCTTCKRWLPVGEFPSARGESENLRRECRECDTKARQSYRERHKEPCVACGTPALPPREKGATRLNVARCRPCYYRALRDPDWWNTIMEAHGAVR